MKLMRICACAAIVAVMAPGCGKKTESAVSADAAANLRDSLAIDISGLKSGDGQPLLLPLEKKQIPPRPDDPAALPETDPLHWYDMEYAGWSTTKEKLPASPKDGAIGKKVITIINGDHPYLTAYSRGQQKVADAYKMKLTILSPNWKIAAQNQMIEQAINERPDMIIIIPLDAKVAVQQARKVWKAGIPVILSNMLPQDEALKYCICWTGPDDFGQFRMLARAWADKLGKKGGEAFVQHAPGGSPYFARCWGPISELSGFAPDLTVLDKQAPGFDAIKTQQVVADWLTRFGPDLTGICAADDSAQAIGIIEALRKAGRTDVAVVAAGNSKVGMDAVKRGDIFAITYQSAEADGAVALKAAVDWFNGLELPPVRYLPQHVITMADVDKFNFTVEAGRVTGDQSLTLQFKAVFPDGV